jgi:hypothetical protein
LYCLAKNGCCPCVFDQQKQETLLSVAHLDPTLGNDDTRSIQRVWFQPLFAFWLPERWGGFPGPKWWANRHHAAQNVGYTIIVGSNDELCTPRSQEMMRDATMAASDTHTPSRCRLRILPNQTHDLFLNQGEHAGNSWKTTLGVILEEMDALLEKEGSS